MSSKVNSVSFKISDSSLSNIRNHTSKRLLIFDWDDTILPSTWLNNNQLNLSEESKFSSEHAAELEKLSDCALKMLTKASQVGTIVFITNAEQGWIELSGQKFLPKISSFITEQKIKLFSARSTYEFKGFASPLEWKKEAFKYQVHSHLKLIEEENEKLMKLIELERKKRIEDDYQKSPAVSIDNLISITTDPSDINDNEIYSVDNQCISNRTCSTTLSITEIDSTISILEKKISYIPHIISLGDSLHEREATLSLSSMYNAKALFKTLKLLERPTISQLIKQHELISGCISDIACSNSPLDLCIRCC